MCFLFIKIFLRIIKLNLKPIFIDESKPVLKNENFKTWILSNDFCHYGEKINAKKNILLAVGIDKLYYYEIKNENTNSIVFKNFLINLFQKIPDSERKEYILIMDNLAAHGTKDIKNLVTKYKIKILYTVPYESCFNPIELSFHFIKNKIYRFLFENIDELKIEVDIILNSKEFENSLIKNYHETLAIYYEFIINNKNIDLNII